MSLRSIFLTLFMLVPVVGWTQSSIEMEEPLNWGIEEQLFEAEALIVFYSLGGESTPSFGASLDRELLVNTFFGFRALLPFQDDSQINIYSLQTYSRYFFLRKRASVYGELDFGLSGISGREVGYGSNHFLAGGLSFGMQYELNSEVTVGGMIGGGLAGMPINNDAFIYPKVAMTTTLKF